MTAQEPHNSPRVIENSLKDSEIRLFRRLLIIGGLAVPITGFFYTADPHAYDPWGLRLMIGTIALAIVALSYIDKPIKKTLDLWYYIYLYFFVGWTSYLFTLNHFSGNYLLGVLGTFIFLGFAKIRSTTQLIVYLIYYSILLSLSLFFVSQPVMAPMVILGVSFCFILAAYLSIQTKCSIEQKLQESEKALFTVFNESADGILLLDQFTSKIYDCNEAATTMLGEKNKEAVINKEIFSVMTDLLSFNDNISYEVIKHGFFQKRGKTKNLIGRSFWADVNIKSITIHNKQMLLVRVTDITTAMEFEERLRSQKEELEKLNAFMVGRELKISELKKQIEELESKNPIAGN